MPPISIDPIEAIWLFATVTGAIFTFFAVMDARADWIAHKKLSNGTGLGARGTAAVNDLRRELLRLTIQLALLSIAVPAIFSDRVITLSWPLLILMYVPLALLLQSILDRLARIQLSRIPPEALLAERLDSDRRIQRALDALRTDLDVETKRNDVFTQRLDSH